MTIIDIDLSMLSGIDPETVNLANVSIDFSPFVAYEIEDGEWLTRAIRKVKCPAGIGAPVLPPTPTGRGYEVQERGFRGARHGYITVPDQERINYSDIQWVTKASLDPVTPPDPAWLLAWQGTQDQLDELSETVSELELGAASDSAVATQVTDGELTGAAVDARIATGITGKADQADLDAEASARSDADAALSAALTAETDRATLAEEALDAEKQPFAAMLTKLAALAATLTNGQLIGWNDTLDEPVAVNPSGNSLNAAAINNSGSSTAFTSVAATIPGTGISVTNSNGRTVALEFEGCFQQTVVGTGLALLMVYETTGGANTFRMASKRLLSNSTVANLANLTWDLNRLPIGVVTTTRTFELRAIILVASGTPGASTINSTTNPTLLEAHNQ